MTGHMIEEDRKIVLELKRRLSADLQKRVIEFILYGSRARGVDAEDSDLDLVALVDEKTPEIESVLDDLAYGVMWDYDFKTLYDDTNETLNPGPDCFAALWPVAQRLLSSSTGP